MKPSSTEIIKKASQGLRGTLKESLLDEHTGQIREDDRALIKFHGMYEQDDRDRRAERAEKKLDRLYSFMIRLRLPGGMISADQWVELNNIAGAFSTGVIKVTTRQTIQLHGILKSRIKPTIQAFNRIALDSIAACGDVNRNVIAAAHPAQSPLHSEIHALAGKISAHLKPKTRAYYEVWLDDEKIAEKTEEDPLYQEHYLPRKFKVGIAIPPHNDIDVFANDVGLIAIIREGELKGFNVVAGGGMGMTYGNKDTYPRLATALGFIDKDEATVLKTVYEIATVQRDWGNRSDRKRARLKYTLDQRGPDAFKAELEKRIGFPLGAPEAFVFEDREDQYGWQQDASGRWHYLIFIENGLIRDTEPLRLKSGLLQIGLSGKANIRFTCNQNLLVSDILPEDKPAIHELLDEHGILRHTNNTSLIRRNAIACVALNTCPLAFAEAQRYMPALISKIEELLQKYDLAEEPIVMRMTGCPNGCARPYMAEIGFTGIAPGKYNLYLGGDREGLRLNSLYKESLDETGILTVLDDLFKQFSAQRLPGETFGDFAQRNVIKAEGSIELSD